MYECDFSLYSRIFKSPSLLAYTVCGNGSGRLTVVSWREFEVQPGLINYSFKPQY